jgi:hypothetical protein
MMNISVGLITALSSMISIIGIWYLSLWLFRDYNVDSFRQKIFGLRDELFDFAMNDSVDFGSPAYGMLRAAMNGMIRFAHRMSLSNLIIFLLLTNEKEIPASLSFYKRWEENTKHLNPEVKAKLLDFRQRMNTIVMGHLIVSSPLLMLTVIVPICALILLKLFLNNIMNIFERQLNSIDSAALKIGELT